MMDIVFQFIQDHYVDMFLYIGIVVVGCLSMFVFFLSCEKSEEEKRRPYEVDDPFLDGDFFDAIEYPKPEKRKRHI